MLKDLLERARRMAEQHLPEDVLDAGRKLGRTVAAHAPAPLAEVIDQLIGEPEPTGDASKGEAAKDAPKPEPEGTKAEGAKVEAATEPASKRDAPKGEAAKPGSEAAKPDAPGSEAAKRDAPGSEAAKRDAPGSEAAKRDALGSEAAKSNAPGSEAAKRDAPGSEAAKSNAPGSEAAKPDAPTPSELAAARSHATPGSIAAVRREDPEAVLARVKAKAERGLKPEDRLVVVYATPAEDEEVRAIMAILSTIEAEVRHNDLRREPQTARQLAKLTGVMVPPYVFINGRHWGNRYDLESLAAWGDLPLVVANLLDEISPEARRMGRVHESFSDEISVDNILTRWRLGHILCVDDLDSWYEVDRDQEERFFYQGGPHPAEEMPAVAAEIVRAVEAGELEAVWQLEPSVHLP
jgi:glutaredoxin